MAVDDISRALLVARLGSKGMDDVQEWGENVQRSQRAPGCKLSNA